MGRLSTLLAPMKERDVLRVWVAEILSDLGDWAAIIALAILLHDETGSATWAAAPFAVMVVPTIGLGPWLATLGDRYPRRDVMIVADVVRAVVYVGLAFVDVPALVLVLAFVAASASAPFEAARSALVAETVPVEQRHNVVVVRSIAGYSTVALGFLAGGGLVGLLDVRWALLVNASTFVASGLLVATVRVGRTRSAEVQQASAAMRAAFGVVGGPGVIRSVTVVACTLVFGAVAAEGVAVVYAADVLDRGSGTAGALSAAVPIATVIASVLIPFDLSRRSPLRWIGAVAAAGAGLSVVGLSVADSFVVALAGFGAIGLVYSTAVFANSVFSVVVPDDVRASVFGLIQAAFTGAQALGVIVAGVLSDLIGVRLALGCVLGIVVVVGAAATFSDPMAPIVTAGAGDGAAGAGEPAGERSGELSGESGAVPEPG
jgi:MFS family permease